MCMNTYNLIMLSSKALDATNKLQMIMQISILK